MSGSPSRCAKARATEAEACCSGRSTSRLNECGTGMTAPISSTGNHAARNRVRPPKASTIASAYRMATSGSGGSCTSQPRFTVRISRLCSRKYSNTARPMSSATPHQGAAFDCAGRQPMDFHARRMSAAQINGTTSPMDFRSSLRQDTSSSPTAQCTAEEACRGAQAGHVQPQRSTGAEVQRICGGSSKKWAQSL